MNGQSIQKTRVFVGFFASISMVERLSPMQAICACFSHLEFTGNFRHE